MTTPKDFVPILSINNKKETKTIDVEGTPQEVELPAKEGFNIETRDSEGAFKKEFFTDKLEAVILTAKHELRSKFSSKDFYFSNEFEFGDGKDHVRIYSPTKGKVLFEGKYEDAVKEFDTGQQTKSGYAIKDFDVYVVLYILFNGQIYRFRWKMNQNCNWFDYKKTFENSQYYSVFTKFNLEKKTAGSNTFWVCNLERGEDTDVEAMAIEAQELLTQINKPYETKTEEIEEEEINVKELPF